MHLEYAREGLEISYEDVHDSKTPALHKTSTKRVIQGGANWRPKVIPLQYMSLRVLQWDEEEEDVPKIYEEMYKTVLPHQVLPSES